MRFDGAHGTPLPLPPDRRQPREGQRSCAPIPRKPEMQYLNRIGRRMFIFILLIAALAIIWNLLGR